MSALQDIIRERDADRAADEEAERTEADKRKNILKQYFYQEPSRYLFKAPTEFLPLNENNVKRRIKRSGFSSSEADDLIMQIQEDNHISRVYPYQPARKAQVYNSRYKPYIVMNDYPFPYPVGTKGNCKTILLCLNSLFGSEQMPYLLAWLKGARRRIKDTLSRGDYSTACQILAILGDHDTGKTNILCKRIVLPMLGGEPVDYGAMLKHGKQFNGELMSGCLLLADDKGKPQGNNARRRMADTMKDIGYNGSFAVEGKGKDSFSIRAPWAQIVLANDDDSGIESIPDFSGMDDKFIALHAKKRPDFPPNSTEEERRELDAAIESELAAFAWYLDHYTPPDDIREPSGRHMCNAYVAPSVQKYLQPLTEEANLMNAIEMLISDPLTIDRICTPNGLSAATIQAELSRKYWRNEGTKPMGRKLTRLCELYPDRIRKRTVHGNVLYVIARPAEYSGDEE